MRNNKIIGSLVVMVFVIIFLIPMTNSRSLNLNNTPDAAHSLYDDNLIPVNFSIYIGDHYPYGSYPNWSYYVDNYDWCSGNGTESNPYIIEGIHVTNENQTAHIWIEDVKHFIIRNVTVSNYAKPVGHYTFAGIYIGNGQFGLIENVLIVNCSIGISLANGHSFDITQITHTINITNCRFIGSHDDSLTGMGGAITLHGANFGYELGISRIRNINISHNDIYNYYGGILVSLAEDIYIGNNRIETTFGYVVEVGIDFYTVNDSTITNNDFYGCELGGHDYDEPKTSSDGFSIDLVDCSNILVYGNRYYDLDGNLITEFNAPESIYWIFVILGIVIVVVVSLIIFKKRKSN